MKVKVINLDKLQNKIDALSNNMDLSKAITRGALRVERDAKILVPVDTGLLRSSITHSVIGNSATVGTSIEYAAKVELGIGQRRQPYLTPALNLNRTIITQEIKQGLHEELKRVTK